MTRFVFWSVPLNGSRWCMRLGKLTEFHEEKNYRTPSWKIWQRPRLPVNPSNQPNDMYPSCWWDVGQPIHFAGSYPPFLLVNDGLGLRPSIKIPPYGWKLPQLGELGLPVNSSLKSGDWIKSPPGWFQNSQSQCGKAQSTIFLGFHVVKLHLLLGITCVLPQPTLPAKPRSS